MDKVENKPAIYHSHLCPSLPSPDNRNIFVCLFASNKVVRCFNFYSVPLISRSFKAISIIWKKSSSHVFWKLVKDKSLGFLVLCICDALHCLVPFVQFKKRENTHGEKLRLVKLQTSAKSNTLPWVFFTFLICTNGTKSRNAPHIKFDQSNIWLWT